MPLSNHHQTLAYSLIPPITITSNNHHYNSPQVETNIFTIIAANQYHKFTSPSDNTTLTTTKVYIISTIKHHKYHHPEHLHHNTITIITTLISSHLSDSQDAINNSSNGDFNSKTTTDGQQNKQLANCVHSRTIPLV